ncbi:MAG: hypothetical protein ACYC6C_06285 [Coriobacteriia bacterium]
MKRLRVLAAVLLVGVLLAACAPGPNPGAGQGDAAGFWLGLWHGFIALFTFVISLFNDNVSMYEVANNGGWYNFGFLLGMMTFWGGGGAARGSRSR